MTGEQRTSGEVAVQDTHPIESVFVSYNRDDRERVGELVEGLNRLGYRVWLDQDLSGGQDWWEAILGQIRACDALLLVVSPAELESQACREEVGYARGLGKPVVPVMVHEVQVERLPPDLARLQLVDYTGRSRNEGIDLTVALQKLSAPAALPDPLPVPPPVPMSYLNDLYQLVNGEVLTLDQQFGIIGRLKPALNDPKERDMAIEILQRLNGRRDLYREAANELAAVLATVKPTVGSPPPSTDAAKAESGPTDRGRLDPAVTGAELGRETTGGQPPKGRKLQLFAAGLMASGLALIALVLFGPWRTPQYPPPTPPPTSSQPTYAPTTPTSSVRASGVPNVYKVSEAQARAALNGAGYNVQIYRVCSSSVAAGYVRQALQVNPDSSETILVDSNGVTPAGRQLAQGSTVTLKISTGVACA